MEFAVQMTSEDCEREVRESLNLKGIKSGNSGLQVIPDVQCKSIEKFQIVRTYQQPMLSRKQRLFVYSSY